MLKISRNKKLKQHQPLVSLNSTTAVIKLLFECQETCIGPFLHRTSSCRHHSCLCSVAEITYVHSTYLLHVHSMLTFTIMQSINMLYCCQHSKFINSRKQWSNNAQIYKTTQYTHLFSNNWKYSRWPIKIKVRKPNTATVIFLNLPNILLNTDTDV